jgi:electron transfer flavoprotein alpha subunit
MPPTLVLLDHGPDGALPAATLEVVTAARALGPVDGAWIGDGLTGALDQLGRAGVRRVHHLSPGGDDRWPAVVAECLLAARQACGASLVLLASTHEGTEIAAGLAARSARAAVVTDVDGLQWHDGALEVTKSGLAGTWVCQVQVTAPVAVLTVKPNAQRAEDAEQPVVTEVVELACEVSPLARAVQLVARTPRADTGRPDLAGADVVVVAGRGVEGDLGPVDALADELGAAVGATRVVSDEGWMAREQQIGQTGVVISPRLYIGAGVSGAVHHRGGMQSSGIVVAVNNDPDAPIFEIADYGIVGDLFEVLPTLTAELHRLRAQG